MINEVRLIDANAFEKRTLERFNTLTLALVIGTTNSTGDLMDMEYFKYWLNSQPTVDAKPMRCGEWIYNTDDFTPHIRCSVCGYNKPLTANETTITEIITNEEPLNFCNNCGAKMKRSNDL